MTSVNLGLNLAERQIGHAQRSASRRRAEKLPEEQTPTALLCSKAPAQLHKSVQHDAGDTIGTEVRSSGARSAAKFKPDTDPLGASRLASDSRTAAHDQSAALLNSNPDLPTSSTDGLLTRLRRKGDSPSSAHAERVEFQNDEANEGALNIARKVPKVHRAAATGDKPDDPGCPQDANRVFLQLVHGRSMGALSVTSTEKYQAPCRPLIPGVDVGTYDFGCLTVCHLALDGLVTRLAEWPLRASSSLALSRVDAHRVLQSSTNRALLARANAYYVGTPQLGRHFSLAQ
ncbi:hypothetical protein V8E55_008122 [Tylopilus felleus]